MNTNLLVFNDYKFRASSIGDLMTGLKLDLAEQISELEADIEATKNKTTATYQAKLDKLEKLRSDELPQTAKSKLIEIYVTCLTDRKHNVVSKYMEKGKSAEDGSIDLLGEYLDDFFVKNDERKENEYVTGECDIVTEDEIMDVKSCWDLFTFEVKKNEPLNAKYEWQLRAYMWLWNIVKARIAYVLSDTPDSIIADECKRLLYQIGSDKKDTELYNKACDAVAFGMKYEDIPVAYRVFLTDYVTHDDVVIEAMCKRLDKCREFLNWYAQKEYNRVNKIQQEIVDADYEEEPIIETAKERVIEVTASFEKKLSEMAINDADNLVMSGEVTNEVDQSLNGFMDNIVELDPAITKAIEETIPQEHQAQVVEDIKTEINEDGNMQIVIPFPEDRKSEILSIIAKTDNLADLTRLYSECKALMAEYPNLKDQFTKRKLELKGKEEGKEAPKTEVKKPIKKVSTPKEQNNNNSDVVKDDACFMSLLDDCETSISVKSTFQANKTEIQKRPDILQAYIAKGQMLVNKEKEAI